jgi:hypothetical protein
MILSADRTFRRFVSLAWRDTLDQAGVAVLASPPRRHAAGQDSAERAFLASIRNRIETLIGLLKSEHGLGHHGARSLCGLVTRTAGILTAFTLVRYCKA